MSFIGKHLLEQFDSRLRQVYSENSTIPFGGRSIILVGNVGQLPPILDRPINASKRHAK